MSPEEFDEALEADAACEEFDLLVRNMEMFAYRLYMDRVDNVAQRDRMARQKWRTTGRMTPISPSPWDGTPVANKWYSMPQNVNATVPAKHTAHPGLGAQIDRVRFEFQTLHAAYWEHRRETGERNEVIQEALDLAWAKLCYLDAPETL